MKKKIIQSILIIMSIIIFVIGIIVLIHSDFDFKLTIIGLSLLFGSNMLFVSQIINILRGPCININFLNISDEEMLEISNTTNMINNQTF